MIYANRFGADIIQNCIRILYEESFICGAGSNRTVACLAVFRRKLYAFYFLVPYKVFLRVHLTFCLAYTLSFHVVGLITYERVEGR